MEMEAAAVSRAPAVGHRVFLAASLAAINNLAFGYDVGVISGSLRDMASSLHLRLPFKNKQSGPLTSQWPSARLGIGILCYSMTLSRERWSPSWQLARQGSLGFRRRPHTISICLLVSRSVNQYRLAGRVWADNSGRM